MLLAFFVIGTLWFWAAIVALTLLLLILENADHPGGASLALVTFLVLTAFANPVFCLDLWHHDRLTLAGSVLAYLAAGPVWAVVRWEAFCARAKRKLLDLRAAFLQQRHASDASALSEDERRAYVAISPFRARGKTVLPAPVVGEWKSRIIGWMVYWPWSMLWTLIDEPVRRFFHGAYVRIAGLLQARANAHFADVGSEADL